MATPKTEPNVMGFGYTAEGERYLLIGIREVKQPVGTTPMAPYKREKPGCLARGIGMALILLALLLLLTSCKEYMYQVDIDGEIYICENWYRSIGDCGVSYSLVGCMGYESKTLVRNVEDYFAVEKILVSD